MKKARNYKFYIRRSHRFLGIFIGIQFLLWTLGGLYFSWTDIEEIRGEHFQKHSHHLSVDGDFVSPTVVISELSQRSNLKDLKSLELITVIDEPFYKFVYESTDGDKVFIANARNGKLREQFSESDAKLIAVSSLNQNLAVKDVAQVTHHNVSGHHEYREKPLPAWAVTFENDLTVYVAAETGQIGAFRTNKWRIFDFLWMLHTMDFNGRDNINNYLLRGFSILGIITVCSGFALFFVSSRPIRKFLFGTNRGNQNAEISTK